MYKFKLPLGDWSKDGHGICEWFVIESNKPVNEVREAYFKSVAMTGFNLANELCNDYEDSTITVEQAEKLESIGIDLTWIKEDCWYDNDLDSWSIDSDVFLEILFMFIKLSDPDLMLVDVPDTLESFDLYKIGQLGYGLFLV